jgi:hypothetical protein
MIAIETGAAEAAWGCAAAPESLDTVGFGVPGLGAPTEEVAAGLGESPQDSEGRFGYVSEMPSATIPGRFVVQTLVYRVSNGTVNALAVIQKTAD